jgi:hypothetical protein
LNNWLMRLIGGWSLALPEADLAADFGFPFSQVAVRLG